MQDYRCLTQLDYMQSHRKAQSRDGRLNARTYTTSQWPCDHVHVNCHLYTSPDTATGLAAYTRNLGVLFHRREHFERAVREHAGSSNLHSDVHGQAEGLSIPR